MNVIKSIIGIFLCSLLIAGCSDQALTKQEEMKINDIHSYAVPDESVVTHLDWEAKIDFENHVIAATAILQIENNNAATKLLLDTKDLNINQVLVDGTKVEYELGKTDKTLGQSLTIPIKPEAKKVAIRYTTSKNAEALQWLSPTQTADNKGPFLFTQSQAILARSWVPIQDSPGIRFTYNAVVSVPKGMLALMSAENPEKVNPSGKYSFEMQQPIPAYLLALSVGYLEFEKLGERSGVYAEPSVLEKAAYEFGDIEKMISAAEELYGPYRWGRYDILVLPPSFPFGGMENPRLTFATPTILAGDRSLTSLVAHELAHSWSGNLVTNATWNDFWLNEGFTVYFEQRIMEALYGKDYAEMLASLAAQDLKAEIEEMTNNGNENDTKLKLDLEGRSPDDGMTSIAYDKGYLFLLYLEEKVGRDKWDEFLKNYFERNAFKVMTTDEFVDQLETFFTEKRINLGSVKVNEWIYQKGLPDDAVIPKSNRFDIVDESMQSFIQGTPAKELETNEWTSHEWLHFVRAIPDTMTLKDFKELDRNFKFTQTGNSEILAAWLVKSIHHKYEAAYSRLESFLIHTGRRKFLTPIYSELIKSEEGRKMASDIYAKAKPNYHFVATNTIGALLNE